MKVYLNYIPLPYHKKIDMNRLNFLFQEALPLIQEWLRDVINEEVTKALEADHAKKRLPKQYSRQEVCKMLGISMPTLWAKTKCGEIKATKIGRRVVYDEREIQRFLAQ